MVPDNADCLRRASRNQLELLKTRVGAGGETVIVNQNVLPNGRQLVPGWPHDTLRFARRLRSPIPTDENLTG